ncbi:thioredoxin, mitochondrial [Ornithorhynchus anatinus]|nr:thioredoxin, mitochondrial [Ornithorhynchus anatinus]
MGRSPMGRPSLGPPPDAPRPPPARPRSGLGPAPGSPARSAAAPGSDVRGRRPPAEVTAGRHVLDGRGPPIRLARRYGEMAQRAVLRRVLAAPWPERAGPLLARARPGPAVPPPAARALLLRPGPPAPRLSARTFYNMVPAVTFHIQDGPDFENRVVKSQTPVIVDFHAQWCGPCKILGPRLEKMVAKQEGKVLMAKVDIDDNTDLAIEYEVSAVPTVLAIKNGDVVDKFVGIKDDDQLEAFLKKLIGC